MLATWPYSSPSSTIPKIPSPLSPRSTNIYGRQPATEWMANMDDGGDTKSAMTEGCQSDLGIAPWKKKARPTIRKAPSPRPDELKSRRRSMFLRKVHEGREDKRFEARSEHMMRLDFMQKQKAWEAERARDAPSLPFEVIEQEEDEISSPTLSSGRNGIQIFAPTSQPTMPSAEIDDLIRHEFEEVQALLAYMPPNEDEEVKDAHSDYIWSDDDDYDSLFSEVLEQEQRSSQHERQAESPHDEDEMAMDLS